MSNNQYNYTDNKTNIDNITNNTKDNINNNIQTQELLVDTLKTKYGLNSKNIKQYMKTIDSLKNNNDYLIDNLNASANSVQTNVESTSNNLSNQLVMNDLIKNQITNVNNEYQDVKQNNINKMRAIDNNTYYAQKYQANIDVMKILIFILIPLLIIIILTNKNIIPRNIAYIISGFILILGIPYLIYRIYDINNRNNLDFTQYNIPDMNFDKIDSNTAQTTTNPPSLTPTFKFCVGADCCDPNHNEYDNSTGKCEPLLLEKYNNDVQGNNTTSTNTTGYQNTKSN